MSSIYFKWWFTLPPQAEPWCWLVLTDKFIEVENIGSVFCLLKPFDYKNLLNFPFRNWASGWGFTSDWLFRRSGCDCRDFPLTLQRYFFFSIYRTCQVHLVCYHDDYTQVGISLKNHETKNTCYWKVLGNYFVCLVLAYWRFI
jgi:hypothetical protein